MDKIWEQIHSNQMWGTYPTEHVIRFVARNYYQKERDKIKILDFGIGAGAHTWYLSREGFDTYGFDGSESAVKNAKTNLQKDGLHATLSVMDGVNMDYGDDFFDAVIDNVCIYANPMKEIQKMYKDVYRVLKKGGKLLTVAFGHKVSGYKTGEEVEQGTYCNIQEGALKDRGLSHIYAEGELEELLVHTGFRNIVVDEIVYTDKGATIHLYVCQSEK